MLYDVLLFCRDIYPDVHIPFKFTDFIIIKIIFIYFIMIIIALIFFILKVLWLRLTFSLFFPLWKIQIPYKTSSFCLADSTLPVHMSQ